MLIRSSLICSDRKYLMHKNKKREEAVTKAEEEGEEGTRGESTYASNEVMRLLYSYRVRV
jgi:hypothetical protein